MDGQIYKTKILNIAAYLYTSKELQFEGTERIGKEVFFKFTPIQKADELVKEYFDGGATVNPRDLFARLNDLRDIIFSNGGKDV